MDKGLQMSHGKIPFQTVHSARWLSLGKGLRISHGETPISSSEVFFLGGNALNFSWHDFHFRQRERERKTETQRHRDTETERQTDRQTHRERERVPGECHLSIFIIERCQNVGHTMP